MLRHSRWCNDGHWSRTRGLKARTIHENGRATNFDGAEKRAGNVWSVISMKWTDITGQQVTGEQSGLCCLFGEVVVNRPAHRSPTEPHHRGDAFNATCSPPCHHWHPLTECFFGPSSSRPELLQRPQSLQQAQTLQQPLHLPKHGQSCQY